MIIFIIDFNSDDEENIFLNFDIVLQTILDDLWNKMKKIISKIYLEIVYLAMNRLYKIVPNN